MMQFDLYIGKLLYLSTTCVEEAFRTFKRWKDNGADVSIRFISVRRVA